MQFISSAINEFGERVEQSRVDLACRIVSRKQTTKDEDTGLLMRWRLQVALEPADYDQIKTGLEAGQFIHEGIRYIMERQNPIADLDGNPRHYELALVEPL